MIGLAGGTPITTGSKTDFSIPLEKLIAADPELILLGDGAYGVTADQVKGRAGWKVMTAVKNGAIKPGQRPDHHATRTAPRRGPPRAGDGHPPGSRAAVGRTHPARAMNRR